MMYLTSLDLVPWESKIHMPHGLAVSELTILFHRLDDPNKQRAALAPMKKRLKLRQLQIDLTLGREMIVSLGNRKSFRGG
jgi:hypothetical protein